METPGATLERLRKRAGLRQGALAERIGCSRGLIGLYERGLSPISAESALWLARALACHPGELRPDLPWPGWKRPKNQR